MDVSLHLTHEAAVLRLDHVDSHKRGEVREEQDYYRLRFQSRSGEAVVYATAAQLAVLGRALDEASQDRYENVKGRTITAKMDPHPTPTIDQPAG